MTKPHCVMVRSADRGSADKGQGDRAVSYSPLHDTDISVCMAATSCLHFINSTVYASPRKYSMMMPIGMREAV